jgi:hypothetical protein
VLAVHAIHGLSRLLLLLEQEPVLRAALVTLNDQRRRGAR